jgi:hypothetical protein
MKKTGHEKSRDTVPLTSLAAKPLTRLTVDIFLFRRVKSELTDLSLSQGSFNTSPEGVI